MKRLPPSLFVLPALAALDGWLLSHLNIIGRLGVNYLYTEYRFLTTWWKGALLALGIWLLLAAAHHAVSRRMPLRTARTFHATALVLALVGWYATYQDFRSNLAHRLIGERFHLGAYLFWLVWIGIALRAFTLVYKPKTSTGLQS